MKRIKLLALLSFLVVPTLGSTSFFANKEYESNLVTTEPKDFKKNSLTNPEPVEEHYFRIVGKEDYYDTFADAIASASDNDTIQVLKDFSTVHEPESEADLPEVSITKSLTIDGVGDDGLMHQIIGQKIKISGNVTVNFENVIINGDKRYNKSGDKWSEYYLIGCEGSTINLNKHTVIKNYKFYGFSVIKLGKKSVLNINDQTEITDCAAKFGLIRFNDSTDCPAVYMNGGKIHDNYSSNRGLVADNYVEGLVFYIMGSKDQTKPTKFYMYGGEIYNNIAECWDDPEKKYNSVGLIFLHNGFVDIKILGGSIHDNVAKLGGAMCFGYHIEGTRYDYRPDGNVEIGGNAFIYDNHGIDDNGKQFNSNIYVDRPDVSTKNVVVSQEYPLTKDSKTGILFSDKDLPEAGTEKTAVQKASFNDLPHFIADNENYTMRYQGDTNHTLAIYRYRENEPHLTDPVFNDDLHYNGKVQPLIYTPGKVTSEGAGTLLYSQNYEAGMEIDDADWTDNPNEICGKESGDYNVAYYVTASDPYVASEIYIRTVHIGKILMEIIWPEDNFVYNGEDQSDKLKPHYTKEGKDVPLNIEELKLEGGRTPEGGFKEVTEDPNNRYVVTAVDPKDDSLDFPKEHSKFYTMRISEEKYIEEGRIEIEIDEESKKPTVEIKPEAGYDAWTTLVGKQLDKSEDKTEYETAVNDLTRAGKIDDKIAAMSIYDVTMLSHLISEEGEVVKIVRELDGNLKISLLLSNGITKNSHIIIYQIHENEDGSKVVKPLTYKFEKDGYVTFTTNQLSAFAVIKQKISLLWLIITLSVTDVLLVGGIIYVLLIKPKKAHEEKVINQAEEEVIL